MSLNVLAFLFVSSAVGLTCQPSGVELLSLVIIKFKHFGSKRGLIASKFSLEGLKARV